MSGWDLTVGATTWLAKRPPSWTHAIEGVRVAVHHARPGNDLHGIYPDATFPDFIALLD